MIPIFNLNLIANIIFLVGIVILERIISWTWNESIISSLIVLSILVNMRLARFKFYLHLFLTKLFSLIITIITCFSHLIHAKCDKFGSVLDKNWWKFWIEILNNTKWKFSIYFETSLLNNLIQVTYFNNLLRN